MGLHLEIAMKAGARFKWFIFSSLSDNAVGFPVVAGSTWEASVACIVAEGILPLGCFEGLPQG